MEKKILKDFLYEKESYLIRGAAFEVWKTFKGIFKEKIVVNALKRELENRGLKVESQKRINIFYKGEKVGIYIPDQIINDSILIEVKVKPYLTKEDERQFWYYLRGSSYKLGFLINFGSQKLEIKRRIYEKAREKYKTISVVQRTYQRQSASTKGFTLLELTVVIAIIILLSGIVLTNYRVGEREYALLRSAYKLAQDLRQVEKMATASETLPSAIFPSDKDNGGFPKGGYGIFFQNNSNSYILFADCDGDKEYDETGAALSCAKATPGNPYPEKIKELFLEEKIKISNLYPSSPFFITFFPPDPVIEIKSGGLSYNSATITLTYDGEIKTVKINTVGLIEID